MYNGRWVEAPRPGDPPARRCRSASGIEPIFAPRGAAVDVAVNITDNAAGVLAAGLQIAYDTNLLDLTFHVRTDILPDTSPLTFVECVVNEGQIPATPVDGRIVVPGKNRVGNGANNNWGTAANWNGIHSVPC